jgi:hypothetical protein
VELGKNIISSIQDIRVRVAREDLTRMDEKMQELENMIYRQDYTYSGSEAVTREMNSVNQQLKRMRENSSKAISELEAKAAGTFSTIVDGYEGILTPDSVSGLTPSRLENLRAQRKSIDQKDYLGKIITSKRWYFAAVMSENSVKRMKQALQTSMELTGKRKFKTALFSFGIQKNPASLVIDEDYIENIPPRYLIYQDPVIDRQKLKADYQQMKQVK